jgi:hypothetical protein
MKMEQCSETSAYKIQTPGNYPEGNIQHTEHGESLKLRIVHECLLFSSLPIALLVTNIIKQGPFLTEFLHLQVDILVK